MSYFRLIPTSILFVPWKQVTVAVLESRIFHIQVCSILPLFSGFMVLRKRSITTMHEGPLIHNLTSHLCKAGKLSNCSSDVHVFLWGPYQCVKCMRTARAGNYLIWCTQHKWIFQIWCQTNIRVAKVCR